MTFKWFKDNWRTITPHRVVNFFQAKWREHTTPILGPAYEQYLWRTELVAKTSPECLKGKCVHCGCDTPDKFWESDACEHGCYPQWLEDAVFQELKAIKNEQDSNV